MGTQPRQGNRNTAIHPMQEMLCLYARLFRCFYLWSQLRLQSQAGTLAFFLAGGLAAFAALLFATANGLVSKELGWGEAARLAAACSAIGAAVESLPLPLDNLTVSAAVALAAHFLSRS